MLNLTLTYIDEDGDVQSSYGVFTGTIPRTSQEEAAQQYAVPTQYQVKPDTLVNKPINSDVPLFGGVPLQTSERLVQESPRDYSGKLPGVVPKEDTAESCISFDHMRPIDERMENLRVGPAENFVNSEQSKSSTNKPRKEDDHTGDLPSTLQASSATIPGDKCSSS